MCSRVVVMVDWFVCVARLSSGSSWSSAASMSDWSAANWFSQSQGLIVHAAGNVVLLGCCWLVGLCSIFHHDSIVGVCKSPTSAFGQKFLQ